MSTSPGDLLGDRDDPYGRQPVEAIIAATPASSSDLLKVSLPAFDDGDDPQGWDLRWPGPRDGGAMPTAGDTCVVVFTRDGTAWVSVWWPST